MQDDVGGIIDGLGSADAEVAEEALDDFFDSVWHQGTVYPETVTVVPGLVELAVTEGVHNRSHLLRILGGICDPEESYGDDQPAVRAAVVAHAARLEQLLDDPDPELRDLTAYVLGQCGDRAALTGRWPLETDPQVRASLLMGLGSVDLAREAALTEPFPVPVAAALVYARAGLPLPSETIIPIAAAFGAAEPWDSPWPGQDGALSEVLELLDGASAGALTVALTSAPGGKRQPGVRSRLRAAEAMADRFESKRSAPVELMPRLRELLTDDDAEVRAAAMQAVTHAGAPSAAVADILAEMAQGTADEERWNGPAHLALNVLARLGDPRWREPLIAAWEAGQDPSVVSTLGDFPPPFDPVVLAAARRRLRVLIAQPMPQANAVIALVVLLKNWGPAAADAAEDVLAAQFAAPWIVPATLAGMGERALFAVPALTAQADRGQVRDGHAVWRLTGDPGPLVRAGQLLLTDPRGRLQWELELLADAGPAAAPLVPLLTPWLTGRAAPNYEGEDQIAAARVVWRATGDTAAVLPTVDAALRTGDSPARSAAKFATELPDVTSLVPALRKAVSGDWGVVDAARALWRSGTPVDDLVRPLLTAAADTYVHTEAVDLLVEMNATSALPGLTALATQDNRVVQGSAALVWKDDRLRRQLHEAIRTLRRG